MIDLRDTLPRTAWSIGHRDGSPTGATLHYNGPPVAVAGTPALEQIQLAADARYHMRAPAIGGIGGDGIQYHYAVLSDGTVAQLRDEAAILWHCANAVGNRNHIAVHLPLGGAQDATPAQWAATGALFEQLIARHHWATRSVILGHREWPRSDGKPQKSCPGPILFRRLQRWRGQLPPHAVTRYRITVDVALVRQGPGQQFKVALNGTARMYQGEILIADSITLGTPPTGSTDPCWVHREDELGFVHMSLVRPL